MIQPVKEKIILGIDPGTNIMGYGVLKVTGVKPQVMALGVIDLRKCTDPYLKLKHIYERVQGVISSYLPDELAIEAPFFGKNVQSMLKLGRAQGVAIVAALCRDIPVTEYGPFMDATDALGAAYCHYLQMGRPAMPKAYSSWKDYIQKNPDKVKK